MPDPDRSALARLRANDPAALDELLRRYWGPLTRYARRLTSDTDIGEDLVQEAFVRVWERRADLDPDSIRGYLYRVVYNLALDEIRRRGRRDAWARAAPREVEPPPRTPLPNGAAPEEESVARALDGLAPRRRQAFMLAYLHQLSYREIAQVMGISAATVKNQVAAALAQLRAVLAPLRAGHE